MARTLALALAVLLCVVLFAGCPNCPPYPHETTDLLPWTLTVPASAEPGEPIGDRMTFTVELDDTADLTGDYFVVAFYLSTDTSWDFEDDLLVGGREQVLLPMTSGELREVSLYEGMAIPVEAGLGSYHILGVIDETGRVTERIEDNNVASAPITVGSDARIYGESNVVAVGEQGHYIDISFTTEEPLTLVDAQWNWEGQSVYLDVDGVSMVDPINEGVDDYEFHFTIDKSSEPVGEIEQIFGFFAEGFDPEDYLRFTMDLDQDPESGGTPLFADLEGGTLTLIFLDGQTEESRVLEAVFDIPWEDNPWAAKAIFTLAP